MGFFHLFLEQSLNTDCKALAYLDIGNAGSVDAVRRKEKLKSVDRRQLEVQGEALEAVKKTYGIWKSVKLNKHALVYSASEVGEVLFMLGISNIIQRLYLFVPQVFF
jgi:hypothetical protein